jgi:phosphoglycolate phosphatase-like HAD superfamily hydrolase
VPTAAGRGKGKPAPAPQGKPDRRGVVAFDMDGTLLDDMAAIASSAAKVLHTVFGTSPLEGERMYLRTTGKPFELQLRELYPEATPFELVDAARRFHDAKVAEAYKEAHLFPEVPKLLKRLDQGGWKLVLSTGAEKEMAEVILEREGVGFLFEQFRGAAQGTKVQHLREFRKQWPHGQVVMVGDSRFDMQAARTVKGVTAIGRACLLRSWAVAPADLRRWGAAWADYDLSSLPEVLDELLPAPGAEGRVRPMFTRRGPGPNAKVHTTGAQYYSGDQLCVVSGCRRKAGWSWQGAFFCDHHIAEEARSAEFRKTALKEARAAARPHPTEPYEGEGPAA